MLGLERSTKSHQTPRTNQFRFVCFRGSFSSGSNSLHRLGAAVLGHAQFGAVINPLKLNFVHERLDQL